MYSSLEYSLLWFVCMRNALKWPATICSDAAWTPSRHTWDTYTVIARLTCQNQTVLRNILHWHGIHLHDTQRQQTTLLTMNQTLFREHSESTICVSVSIDSRGRTIHNAHHISLHSSSDTEPTHQSPHKLHIRHNCSSSSANQLHRTASHYGLVHTVYINLLQRNVIRALHTIYHTCEALQ